VTHKSNLLDALSWAPNQDLIQRTLLYTLEPAVRSQDLADVLVKVAERGGLAFDLTWKFIVEHADHIKDRFPGKSPYLRSLRGCWVRCELQGSSDSPVN
jgi:hypothetical protein